MINLASTTAATTEDRKPPHAAAARRALRLLLIEDSPDDADLVLDQLRRGGYVVTCERVDTGPALTAALDQHTWDLVIADHSLPQFSSTEALGIIQARKLDLPFIIVSGTIGEDVAVNAMKAGAHDYIMKGNVARLLPAIERELQEAEIRRTRIRAERQRAALLQVAGDIAGMLDFAALLDRVHQRTVELLPCDAVFTFGLGRDTDQMRLLGARGIAPTELAGLQAMEFDELKPSRGRMSDHAEIRINQPTDRTCLPLRVRERCGVTAVIAAPIRAKTRYFGTIIACSTQPGHTFETHQVDLFQGIASQLAVAMETAELYRVLQDEADIVGALARASSELNAAPTIAALLDRLCHLVREHVGCESTHSLLWHLERGQYRAIAQAGEAPERWQALQTTTLSRDELAPLTPLIRKHGLLHIVSADGTDATFNPIFRWLGVSTGIIMALYHQDELIGVQTAYGRRAGGPLTSKQRRIARELAVIASQALARARLMEQLRQANRVKSDFLATMSHELRTPLHIIMGYNDLVRGSDFGPVTDKQAAALAHVDKNARTLLELIESTLGLSSLEAGQIPVNLTHVGVPALIHEVLTDSAAQLEKPDVHVVEDVSSDLPLLLTDSVKLKVVIRNLLENAVKFTDHGRITVAARSTAGGVSISVRDTGIGIPSEALPIIFESFRQGDSSPTRRHGGVGLGLYVCRRMLDLLGGTIAVESEVNRGSTFRLWLPTHAGANPSALSL
jgi:signal transduction histidine kinase/DNA-binding response OmpR family regulator